MVVATGIELGLRSLRLPVLARLVGVRLAAGPDDEQAPVRIARPEQLGRDFVRFAAVERVMRWWPLGAEGNGPGSEGKCLRAALVLGALLRRRRTVLHLGATRRDGGLRLHAWLTVNGAALDPTVGDYVLFRRTA